MNILVVDDEKEIADVIELYLQNDQYSVFKFYTGEDALNCIRSKKIDLAILDIMLPDIISRSRLTRWNWLPGSRHRSAAQPSIMTGVRKKEM